MTNLLLSIFLSVLQSSSVGYGQNLDEAMDDAIFRACGEKYGMAIEYDDVLITAKCKKNVKSVTFVRKGYNKDYYFSIEFSDIKENFSTSDVQSALLSMKARSRDNEYTNTNNRDVIALKIRQHFNSVNAKALIKVEDNDAYVRYVVSTANIIEFYENNKRLFLDAGISFNFAFIIKLQCSSAMYGGYFDTLGRYGTAEMRHGNVAFNESKFSGYFKLNDGKSDRCSFVGGNYDKLRVKLVIGIAERKDMWYDGGNNTRCLVYHVSDSWLFGRGLAKNANGFPENMDVRGCRQENTIKYMVYDIENGEEVLVKTN